MCEYVCGVVWCGVVWCGVVWCGGVWSDGQYRPWICSVVLCVRVCVCLSRLVCVRVCVFSVCVQCVCRCIRCVLARHGDDGQQAAKAGVPAG
jgi:hypothetical protein